MDSGENKLTRLNNQIGAIELLQVAYYPCIRWKTMSLNHAKYITLIPAARYIFDL